MKSLLLLSLLLYGCTTTIYSWEIDTAIKLCEYKGGISYIFYTKNTNVVCVDGSRFFIKNKIINQ